MPPTSAKPFIHEKVCAIGFSRRKTSAHAHCLSLFQFLLHRYLLINSLTISIKYLDYSKIAPYLPTFHLYWILTKKTFIRLKVFMPKNQNYTIYVHTVFHFIVVLPHPISFCLVCPSLHVSFPISYRALKIQYQSPVND